MLYFLHHPAGNVVIRTTNPYIVLQYQHKGWLTTTCFDDVLAEHPEWCAPAASPTVAGSRPPTKNFAATLCNTLFGSLSVTLALIPSYSPAGTSIVAPLLANTSSDTFAISTTSTAEEKLPGNTGPLSWFSAVERKWYHEHGHATPKGLWVMCTEGDKAFDYRLEAGEWNLEMAPGYVEGTREKYGVEK